MDEQLPAVVGLDLGNVVSDVVDLPRAVGGSLAENVGDRIPDCVRDRLPVRPSEVGRRRHRGEVGASFGRGGRCARELPVGELDPVTAHGGVHAPDVVGADLVAEPARAGVDQHRHLALPEAVHLRRGLVEDVFDALQLDEVVSRAHRAELAGAALARPLGDGRRVGARQAPAGLGALDVAFARECSRAVAEDSVEIGAAVPSLIPLAGACGHGAGDLVHERLAPAAEFGFGEREGE
jgi:hypothetical protein